MTMMEAALQLAENGLPVFPLHPITAPGPTADQATCGCGAGKGNCHSPGKHPLTGTGFKDATTDVEQIIAWWTRWPDANIGIPTGVAFDVIDIDGGWEGWKNLTALHGEPETIAMVTTGRHDGGMHLYANGHGKKTVPQGKRGFPMGVEVKAEGGYVVAPPSIHYTGKTYEFLIPFGEINGTIAWDQWYDAVTAQPDAPTRPQAAPVTALARMIATNPDANKAYGAAVLARAVQEVESAPSGTRWNTLVWVGVPLVARAIEGGCLDRAEGTTALEAAATRNGLAADEVARIPELLDRMFASGIKNPIAPKAEWTPDKPLDVHIPTVPVDKPGILPEEFWDGYPMLGEIHAYALAKLTQPEGLLGAVLATACALMPADFVLPGIIGSRASLNMASLLLGASGDGKSTAITAARELLGTFPEDPDLRKQGGTQPVDIGLYIVQSGSGEGIVQAFYGWTEETVGGDDDDEGKGRKQRVFKRMRNNVLLADSEGSSLTSQTQRQGATISEVLLKAWGGEDPSQTYSQRSLQSNVEQVRLTPMSYRLGMIFGMQPSIVGNYLDKAGIGWPQRLTWFTTTGSIDRDKYDMTYRPTVTWRPAMPPMETTEIHVDDTVIVDIVQHHIGVRTGEIEASELDSHRNLNRLKIAAVINSLGHPLSDPRVTEKDWELAGMVLDASDQVRASAQIAMKKEGRRKVEESVDRQIYREERVAEEQGTKVDETADAICEWLALKEDEVIRKDINNWISKRRRPYLEEALDLLEADGRIEVIHRENKSGRGGTIATYHLADRR